MSKTLDFYRDGIRALRESGNESFTSSNGYLLRGDLSSGQKAAISRALGSLESEREPDEESDDSDDSETPWYDDGIESGDFDDIDWFDYDYADDFADEEADSYDEGDAK